jgi:hypothetical protein
LLNIENKKRSKSKEDWDVDSNLDNFGNDDEYNITTNESPFSKSIKYSMTPNESFLRLRKGSSPLKRPFSNINF